MTAALTVWLAFVLSCGTLAFFAPRLAVPFAVIALLTAPATVAILGHPSDYLSRGEYTVIGAKVVEPTAIYVLIDGDEPRYYRLPYSDEAAQELEGAQSDAEADGGKVVLVLGESSLGFSEETPPPEPDKQNETAIIGDINGND